MHFSIHEKLKPKKSKAEKKMKIRKKIETTNKAEK